MQMKSGKAFTGSAGFLVGMMQPNGLALWTRQRHWFRPQSCQADCAGGWSYSGEHPVLDGWAMWEGQMPLRGSDKSQESLRGRGESCLEGRRRREGWSGRLGQAS